MSNVTVLARNGDERRRVRDRITTGQGTITHVGAAKAGGRRGHVLVYRVISKRFAATRALDLAKGARFGSVACIMFATHALPTLETRDGLEFAVFEVTQPIGATVMAKCVPRLAATRRMGTPYFKTADLVIDDVGLRNVVRNWFATKRTAPRLALVQAPSTHNVSAQQIWYVARNGIAHGTRELFHVLDKERLIQWIQILDFRFFFCSECV